LRAHLADIDEGVSRTHACTHARRQACTQAGMHARRQACTHARRQARTHAGRHACTHAGMHARTQASMHARTHARRHACMHARITPFPSPAPRTHGRVCGVRVESDLGALPHDPTQPAPPELDAVAAVLRAAHGALAGDACPGEEVLEGGDLAVAGGAGGGGVGVGWVAIGVETAALDLHEAAPSLHSDFVIGAVVGVLLGDTECAAEQRLGVVEPFEYEQQRCEAVQELEC
jgi:hypothetical protein